MKAAAIPAQYAKFIAALLGEAIAYVQLYGTTWHLEAALVMAGAALAVFGVPNAAAPANPGGVITPGLARAQNPAGNPPERVVPLSGSVTITPPATDRPPAGSL